MRHPDDGNLAALDAHLLEVEQGERRAEEFEETCRQVVLDYWGDVMQIVDREAVGDYLYCTYRNIQTVSEVRNICAALRTAVETVAERISK